MANRTSRPKISALDRSDGDVTLVDAKAAPPTTTRAPLPSVLGAAKKPDSGPHNVIPFAKPRAMAGMQPSFSPPAPVNTRAPAAKVGPTPAPPAPTWGSA